MRATESDRRAEKSTPDRKSTARNEARRPGSGYAWFVTCPLPSYSLQELSKVFAPDIGIADVARLVRTAIRHAELHGFRVGTTNRFPRDEVRRFVTKFHPLSPAERANTAILSKAADVYLPVRDLIGMLESARDGHWSPPFEVTRPDLCWADEVPIGSVENERFPAPNSDHAMAPPPHLSNKVPSLRSRIQASNARDRAQARRARGKANGQNA